MGLDALRRLRQIGADLIGQATPPIGVDFGVGALKLLQVRGAEPPSLLAAASLETPLELLDNDAGRLEFQLKALAKLMKDGRFEGRRVVCSIPASQTWCKPMQLIKNETSAIGDQVMSAASSQLGCDPGALVYRHLEVEGTTAPAGKTEVICMATPREFVKRVVTGLKSAGLEPVGMHSEFAAAVRSFEAVNRRAADAAKTTLYLDIGGGSTKIMIAHGPSMVFARCVDVGGRLFDETIVRQTKWDAKEARATRLRLEDLCPSKTKAAVAPATPANPLPGMAILAAGMRSGGVEPAAAVAQAPAPATPEPDLTEPLEILTDEVALSLRYHESLFPGRKIERVIFLGGESKSRGLCQIIARTLKLPAQLADPLARVGRSGNEPTLNVDMKQPQPGWAVALGLALSPTDL